jgi:Mg2+ and Co2+ transporter CorA
MSNISIRSNTIFADDLKTNHMIYSNIDELNISSPIKKQISHEQINTESIPIILIEEKEEFFNFFYPVRYINSTIYHLANKPVFFYSDESNTKVAIAESIQSKIIAGTLPQEHTSLDITMCMIENMIRMYRIEITRLRRKFDEYEADLHKNKNNQILITLNDFEQTLFYYIDGLKSNLAVLRISNYLSDTQKIETTISHLIQMAETSVAIITSTRETFSNVIANDLNIVMKLLTIITVCLAVPNLFFSFYGMNLNLPFQNSPFSYLIVIILAVAISAWIYFRINKKN